MARQRFTRPLGRGARLRKSWCRDFRGTVGTITTTQTEMFSCTSSELSIGAEGTVLRTRGDFLITCIPNATADTEIVGLGVCVINETARAVGGLSIPGPIADAGSDIWLWHQFVPFDAVTLTAGDPQALTINYRGVIDSKAMRKFSLDQAIVFIAEADQGSMVNISFMGGIAWLVGG